MWSPFEMRVVLHHYASWSLCDQRDAPIYPETVDRLMRAGVIEARNMAPVNETPLQITAMGKALVEMWCRQPLPVVRYADPRFERASHDD